MVLENGKDEFYTYIQILELKSFFTVLFLWSAMMDYKIFQSMQAKT
jgi:hypothetical protein